MEGREQEESLQHLTKIWWKNKKISLDHWQLSKSQKK